MFVYIRFSVNSYITQMFRSKIFSTWNLIILMSISNLCVISNENISDDDERQCTHHDDCAPDECCTFEAVPALTTTTKIIWKCKPLGKLNDLCHSLGNVHCPCQPGLGCIAKAVWFFGSGICGEIQK
ncbi:uncharacterized protein TNIN_397231 [Trichonephila inaurata madagascariensis]|uniref:Prokineticin domain-containing protein n=1 Tax=Trichonephila inaurata madagascariensis TaxID=2747483 RepID=A0A8X6YQ75_9ARAC|nr:uncharacterized protein TNIN_397231 [Trichonephila inaurata madagascariensis]